MKRDSSTDQRLLLAKRRVRNILRLRWIASQYQLQSKISEAGPIPQRCNPHVLSTAIKEMCASGELTKEVGPGNTFFYSLTDYFEPDIDPNHLAHKHLIFDTHQKYRTLSENKVVCGDALELVITKAINASDRYVELGSASAAPLRSLGGVRLKGDLDFILDFVGDPSFYILGEAKNRREWIYPTSDNLWHFIQKCVDTTGLRKKVLPVFVARKIHHLTFPFMKQIGMLGHQTHNQYLNPRNDEEMNWIEALKDKDIMGFFDISTNLTPSTELIRFFSKIVPANGPDASERFNANSDILADYAPKILASTGARTRELYIKLSQDLRMAAEDIDY